MKSQLKLLSGLSLLALSIALAASASKAASFAAATQQPSVALDKTSIDYGEIFKGEELMAVFRVRNTGQEPLQLSETPVLPTKQTVGAYFREPGRRLTPVAASLLTPPPT